MATTTTTTLDDNLIPDRLLCPICFELPKSQVFQCKDGHPLCKNCYSKLAHCPQCRLPFGKDAIRCRFFEATLDDLRFDCSFRELGCGKYGFSRSTLGGHVERCFFNFEKFGSFSYFCKLIGQSGCTFRINHGSTPLAVKHFINNHDFISRNTKQFKIEIKNFDRILAKPSSFKGNNVAIFKNPIVVDLKDEGCAFLIVTMVNREDQSLSWVPLYMPYIIKPDGSYSKKSPFEVKFKIFGEIGGVQPLISWSVDPIDICNAKMYLPDSSPLRSPLQTLVKQFSGSQEGCLRVLCMFLRKRGQVVVVEEEEEKERDIGNEPPPTNKNTVFYHAGELLNISGKEKRSHFFNDHIPSASHSSSTTKTTTTTTTASTATTSSSSSSSLSTPLQKLKPRLQRKGVITKSSPSLNLSSKNTTKNTRLTFL